MKELQEKTEQLLSALNHKNIQYINLGNLIKDLALLFIPTTLSKFFPPVISPLIYGHLPDSFSPPLGVCDQPEVIPRAQLNYIKSSQCFTGASCPKQSIKWRLEYFKSYVNLGVFAYAKNIRIFNTYAYIIHFYIMQMEVHVYENVNMHKRITT